MNKLTEIILESSLVLAGALGTYAVIDHCNNASQVKEEIIQEDKQFRNFPDKLNGAKEIKKYETPGAKYTLVHLRQKHYADSEDLIRAILAEGFSTDKCLPEARKSYREVNDVQKNIYSILEDLIGKGMLKEVYREGFFEEKRSLETWHKLYLNCIDDMKRVGVKKEEVKFAPGADILLALERKLKIKPAESRELNKKAMDCHNEEEYNILKEKREDYIFHQASKEDSSYIFAIYGKEHDFSNNIEEWNKKYPDKKYSLIEIIPKNLK